QMLPSVLLHVIEAPLPFDFRLRRSQAHRAVYKMRNLCPFIHNLQNRRFSNPPSIIRLPTRRWVQRRLVQYDAPSFSSASILRCTSQYLRLKLLHKRVVVINPFGGHANSGSTGNLSVHLFSSKFADAEIIQNLSLRHNISLAVPCNLGVCSKRQLFPPEPPFNPHFPPAKNSCLNEVVNVENACFLGHRFGCHHLPSAV